MVHTSAMEPQAETRHVRIGLVGVGPGSIGQRVHIPSLRRIPQAEVIAVADKCKVESGLPARMYTDWAEMLDNEKLDLVYVMTPPDVHCPIVMAALERGIHVMCEKPPALSVAETRRMVETAQAQGVNLLFDFNRRFAPTYVRMKRLAEERGCHTLILEKTRKKAEWIGPQTTAAMNQAWLEESEHAGGPIFEFMAHLFDLAIWINGPVRAHNFCVRRLYGSSVSLSALGYLEHERGARSIVSYEQVAGCGSERITLHGPALTAVASGGMFAANQLDVHDRGQTQVFPCPEDRLEYGGFLEMSQYIVQCVAQGRTVDWNPVDAIESTRLALAFNQAEE